MNRADFAELKKGARVYTEHSYGDRGKLLERGYVCRVPQKSGAHVSYGYGHADCFVRREKLMGSSPELDARYTREQAENEARKRERDMERTQEQALYEDKRLAILRMLGQTFRAAKLTRAQFDILRSAFGYLPQLTVEEIAALVVHVEG